MSVIRVEHLARVEGHGGIRVELDGYSVRRVEFEIFEGIRLLESLACGRSFRDVSPILSRVCAICSAAHALTFLKATEAAFGVQVSPQTALLRELLMRGENIESHALHFFCLALPDYLGYPSVIALAADRPQEVQLGLRLKKLGNLIQETVGGRAVHPVNAVLGGFARLPAAEQLIALRRALEQGMRDAESAVDLAASLPEVPVCRAETAYAGVCAAGEYGYYLGEQVMWVHNGRRLRFAAGEYRRLTNERPVPHSHARHSGLDGRPFMVGALARLTVRQDRLNPGTADLIRRVGLSLPSNDPLDNNKAQIVELAADVEFAARLVDRFLEEGLADEAPVPVHPRAGDGTAMTEAPRGLLVHSYVYDEQGRLLRSDVVTPTAINAASIEDRFRAAVTQSAAGAADELKHKLEMIARAYDPCLSCSVHLIHKPHGR